MHHKVLWENNIYLNYEQAVANNLHFLFLFQFFIQKKSWYINKGV